VTSGGHFPFASFRSLATKGQDIEVLYINVGIGVKFQLCLAFALLVSLNVDIALYLAINVTNLAFAFLSTVYSNLSSFEYLPITRNELCCLFLCPDMFLS